MPDYKSLRHRIHGPTACLPILYQDDLSIDYEAMARYAAWIRDAGIPATCLTFGYSQQGYITADENLKITGMYASVFGDQTVFLAGTIGESWDLGDTVGQLYSAGAHGVYIFPPTSASQSGDDYVRLVNRIAATTEAPLFVYSFPSPARPASAMLSVQHFENLIENENFVGLKDDVNVPTYRMELIRTFGDRLAITGGGTMRNYIQFHHYPCQSELAGFFGPRRALRLTELLDRNDYAAVLHIVEQWDQVRAQSHGDLFYLMVNQVVMYALGFARTWKTRPPMQPATQAQAEQIIACVRKYPEIFEAAESVSGQ